MGMGEDDEKVRVANNIVLAVGGWMRGNAVTRRGNANKRGLRSREETPMVVRFE